VACVFNIASVSVCLPPVARVFNIASVSVCLPPMACVLNIPVLEGFVLRDFIVLCSDLWTLLVFLICLCPQFTAFVLFI
jgi:hypothetical protein